MHYKNQREAKSGDPVVTRNYAGEVVTGVVFNLRPTAGASCNCDISVIQPGGVATLTCQSVGNLFHAEDALVAIEATLLPPPIAPASP